MSNSYWDYLEHHGVSGMRWGIQNGPPYPLGKDSYYGGVNQALIDENRKNLGILTDDKKEALKVSSKYLGDINGQMNCTHACVSYIANSYFGEKCSPKGLSKRGETTRDILRCFKGSELRKFNKGTSIVDSLRKDVEYCRKNGADKSIGIMLVSFTDMKGKRNGHAMVYEYDIKAKKFFVVDPQSGKNLDYDHLTYDYVEVDAFLDCTNASLNHSSKIDKFVEFEKGESK